MPNDVKLEYKIFVLFRNESAPSRLGQADMVLPRSETRIILRRLIPSTTYYVWVAVVIDEGKESELMSHVVGPINFTTLEEGLQT